jgi:hypothetical protein
MHPIFIVVIVVAVLGLYGWQFMQRKKSLAENQDKTFGAVAERLGLQVLEGDPNQSLYFFVERHGDYQRQLRAQGTPYGRDAFFTLMDGVKSSEYVVYRRTVHSFGCFLETALQTQTTPFEVVLRNPNPHLPPHEGMEERPELREMPSGDAAIDAKYRIRATDPKVPPALVPALRILEQQIFVHIAGEGDRVWNSFTRGSLPYFAYAVEEYLLALETAACSLEGRPLPARVGTAQ